MKTSFSFIARLAAAALFVAGLSACPEVPPADPLVPPPTVVSFTVSQAQVPAGTMVKLSWVVENATELRIDDVNLGTLSGVDGLSGSVDVAVNQETLYVLTVRNARGASDTAVVGVRLSAVEGELLFTGLPSVVQAGESATLAWSAPGTDTVTLTATPGGAINVGSQGTAGTVVVRPTQTTTYTLTAGGRTATAKVTVAATIVSFGASSESVDAGAPVTLSWTTSGATRVQLSAPGRGDLLNETDAGVVASGSYVDAIPAQVDPGQLFAYRLTVSGPGGVTLTRELVVSITGNPAVVSFTAPTVARHTPDAGGFPLSWVTREASAVSIAADGVEIYRAPSPAVAAAGSVVVPAPPQDVTYTLTATGPRGGVATSTASVDIVGLPTIALSASPTSLAAGAPVTLSWTGTDVRKLTIKSPGRGIVYQATGMLDTGSAVQRPEADATYVIEADNSFGDVATATAQATVTNPVTLSVTDTGVLRQGQTAGVTWTAPAEAPVGIIGLPTATVTQRPASRGFEDISTTGTKLVFPSSGNIVAPIVTDFRTTFFGKVVGDQITVSRHGYLVFGPPSSVNGGNSTEQALPTAKLEPYAVAPWWDFMTVSGTGDGVFWQVKQDGAQQVLVVQWKGSSENVEARIYASGQIDFEYATLDTSATVGVTGAEPWQAVAGPTPVVGTGLTFFGRQAVPASTRVLAEGPLAASLEFDGGLTMRVTGTVPNVVGPSQLFISEAMPNSTLGAGGQWVELQNLRDTAVDLAGWSLGFPDGGGFPLSGTVPARGLLVLGASADPAVNGDAGVHVELPNFDLTGVSSVSLARAGTLNAFSIAGADAGVALVNEPGPLKLASGTASTRCVASATYGGQGQRGTPGVARGCVMPYALSSRMPGYFDISATGTPLMSTLDDEVARVDLSMAPVPFFGTPMTSLQVSTNGFASFDTNPVDPFDQFAVSTPSTTNANSVLALLADDLMGNTLTPGAQVFVKRVLANEDPAAADPHWIIQWHHWSTFTTSTSTQDLYNFQLKLFDDGTIEYHYGAMESRTSSQNGAGADSSTWLEDPTGSVALTINAVSTNSPGISPNSAYRFSPR